MPQTPPIRRQFWGNLSFYLTDPGLMTWGLGQFLFGWLAWKSNVLPDCVSVVGMIGGIAGLLTLAVYQSGVVALIQLASFAVWGLRRAFFCFGRTFECPDKKSESRFSAWRRGRVGWACEPCRRFWPSSAHRDRGSTVLGREEMLQVLQDRFQLALHLPLG